MKPRLASSSRLSLPLATALALCLATASSHAFTWNGAGGDDNWGTGANWVGGSPPSVGSGTQIDFAGSTRLTPFWNYTAYDQMGSLFFNSGASSFTLGGTNAMKLSTKIENNSSVLQTIGLTTLVLNDGTATEINPVDGDLTISSAIILDTPQIRVWGNNGKTLTLNGIISTGSATTPGLAINQNSTVVMGAANTYNGDTLINAGTLQFASAGSAANSVIRLGDTITNSPAATLSLGKTAGGQSLGSTLVVRPSISGTQGTRTFNSLNTAGTNTWTGAVYLDADLTTLATAGGTFAFSTGAFDLKNQTLTVDGAGSTTISNLLSNSVGSGKIIKTGTGTLTLASGSSTYSGGTALRNGTLIMGAGSTGGPPPTSGVFGTGSLTLGGGILHTSGGGGGGDRTIGNELVFDGGTTQFGSGASTGWAFYFTSASKSVISNSSIATRDNNGVTFSAGSLVLGANLTAVNPNGGPVGAGLTFSGGFTVNGAAGVNRTVSNSSSGAMTLSGVLAGTAASQTLTVGGNGTGTTYLGNFSSGANVPKLIVAGTNIGMVGGSVYQLTTTASSFSGGFEAQSGIIESNINGSISSSPNSIFGSGSLTFSGGRIRAGANFDTTFDKPFTIKGAGMTIVPDAANRAIVFSNSLMTVDGAATIANFGKNTTIGGLVSSIGTPALTVQGSSVVTFDNRTSGNNQIGNVTIGDNAASGGLAGTMNASTDTVANLKFTLGTGSYTIRNGGTLQLKNTSGGGFNPGNVFNVNNGGTLEYNGLVTSAATPTGLTTLASGARLRNGSGQTVNYTIGTTLNVPTSGVLFYGGPNNTSITNAYPTPTGTLAFGVYASSAGVITTSGATTTSGAQTLAFNHIGGAMTFGGLTLGGNLTLAGVGNFGTTGVIPGAAGNSGPGGAGVLGTVAQSTTSSVTVNMAPTGVVQISNGSTFSGGLTINSGILGIHQPGSFGDTTTKALPNVTSIALNGGVFRATTNTNNNFTLADHFSVGANGGMLEAMQVNNGPKDTTFNGAITGSGALTLRYGGAAANYNNLFLSPTATSTFNGTITLATSNGRGRVQFNNNSLAGIGAGGVTVPAGTTMGVDAIATLTGNLAKFTFNTDSILALNNISGISSILDLSATGINRDIRLGGSTTYSGSPTLIPYGSTYKFTPDVAGITVGVTNLLTGSKNLDLRTAAVSPSAYAIATGALAINNAQDYSGTTMVAGTVLNVVMGSVVQGPTLSLASVGELPNTSAITVDNAATFTLASGANTGASGAAITIKGGGTINVNSASPLRDDVTLTLGGASGGGTYASNASGAQSLSALTVAAGPNTINPNTTGVLTLTGAGANVYTRNAGGVVNFSNLNTSFSNVPTGSSTSAGTVGAGGTQSILIGAFSNNSNFVVANSGALAATTYDTQNDVSLWGTAAGHDGNINNSGGFSGTTATGTVSINALRNVAAFNSNITIGTAATDVLSIKSGMVLQTTALALNIKGPGSLATGASEYIFNTQSVALGLTTVDAKLSSAVPLTMVGGHQFAVLELKNTANAITDVYLYSNVYGNGTLRVSGGAGSLGTGGTVYFNGGALSNNANNATFTQNISVGAQGGLLKNSSELNTTYQTGAMTLNGNLAVGGGAPNNGASGNITINNPISGPGVMLLNGGGNAASAKMIVTLGGNNSSWTGGLRLGNDTLNATQLRINSTSAMGTGPIVDVGRGALYFTNGAANGTFSNDILNSSVIVNWATSNPVTLSGKIVSGGAPLFQGYATGGVASELVLSGSVAFSGISGLNNGMRYNWSTTPTTSIQNFVNGQGGLTVGATNYAGTANIATTTSWNGAGNLYIDGPSGGLVSGALGFIRFDGANSFIPGAVGPGYLAALHQANDANNYGNGTVSGSTGGANGLFGFMLTGGSTYALPEGKSFVMGSMGTSVAAGSGQVGGTLGSAGTGANTAILVGSPKLVGFATGDVNIHANAAGDSQSLNLLARAAGDTLQIGTVGTGVVFTPTYGDSGVAGSMTLMSTRTGATTLNKTGAGTVEVVNAHFNTVGAITADDAKSGVTLNVNAGTLKYTQVDSGANSYAGVNVGAGATLSGKGTIKGATAIAATGTLAPTPQASGSKLTIDGTLALTPTSIFEWTMSPANPAVDPVITTNQGTYGQAAAGTTTGTSVFTIVLGAGSYADTFWNSNKTWDNVFAATGITDLSSVFSSMAGTDLTYDSGTERATATGQGYFSFNNSTTLSWTYAAVPEPTSALAALLLGAGLLRRRRN